MWKAHLKVVQTIPIIEYIWRGAVGAGETAKRRAGNARCLGSWAPWMLIHKPNQDLWF